MALGLTWSLLTDAGRRALQRVALVPGPFPLSLAEAVVGDDAVAAMSELAQHSLLTIAEGPSGRRFRLWSAVAAHVEPSVPEAVAREVSAAVAAWVEAHTPEIADRRTVGGYLGDEALFAAVADAEGPEGPEGAARAAALLAVATLRRGRAPASALLARVDRGLALLRPIPPGSAEIGGGLWLVRAELCGRLGRNDDALESIDRGLAVAADAPGRPSLPAELWLERATVLRDAGAPEGEVFDALQRSLDRAERLESPRFEILARQHLAFALNAAGRTESALAQIERANELTPPAQTELRAAGDQVLGIVLFHAGRTMEAIAACRRAIAAHDALGEVRKAVICRMTLGAILPEAGRLDEAAVTLQAATDAADRLGEAHQAALASVNLAAIRAVQGHLQEASALLRRADRHLSRRGGWPAAVAAGTLGVVSHLRGQTDEARALSDRIAPLLDGGEVHAAAVFHGARAALDAEAGRFAEADASLQRAAALAEGTDQAPVHAAVRLATAHVRLLHDPSATTRTAAERALQKPAPGDAAFSKLLLERALQKP